MKFKKIYESSNNNDQVKDTMKNGSPMYVVTAGIQGSGKSTFAVENFKDIDVVDLDEINKKMSNNDMNLFQQNRNNAIIAKNDIIASHFKMKKSFIDAGTAANTQATLRKLEKAKALGYITVLIYMNIPIEVAIERNNKRLKDGGHGVPIERTQEVISRTDMNVRITVKEAQKSGLVDFYIERN